MDRNTVRIVLFLEETGAVAGDFVEVGEASIEINASSSQVHGSAETLASLAEKLFL